MNQSSLLRRVLAWAPFSLSLVVCACAAPEKKQAAAPAAVAFEVPALEPAGLPGDAGIGDPLFPKAGNGGYDVQSYELAIAMSEVGGPIDASALIRAKSTQALSRFDLDLHELDVHSVEVDGVAATFTRDGDELIITPKKPVREGADFTALVRYGGVPEGVDDQTLPFGMRIGWICKNGEVYVFSEPTGAKSFMPCNDHPRDKALYTLRITVPKPKFVVGNGTLAETIDGGDKRTFVYRPRDPIASYLVTLCIAEFDQSEVAGPNGTTIRNYFAPKTREGVRKSFEKSGEVMKFLGDTFGPYPFETCGNIVASIPIPGALETQTLPLYGAGVGGESIICHEQAHQWFGDTVSVANWQDIWLNEGFAEYASWMYLESSESRAAFEKQVKRQYGAQRSSSDKRARAAAEAASSSKETPKHSEPPGKPSTKTMFSSTVYIRGALSLHALRTEVGDEAFLALMRSWVEKHKNANATVEDFLSHVEHATTPAARAVLEHWVLDEEMPHVAALDEQLAKDKAERDAKRKEREEQKAKETPPAKDPERKKDG